MKLLTLFLAVFSSFYTNAQQTFTTSGNKILDPCGNDFVMKGVNYSLADDWNFPANLNNGKELSAQIMLANPNTVRIQWFADYGQPTRPALTIASLDSVISRFARANIVSVLELHDYTHIHTDTTGFNNDIVGWWISEPVLQLIEKHRKNIIVNIANEYGPTKWISNDINPNYDAEIITWTKHYKSVIAQLRNAGIKVPLMIDAPQYGMDYETAINVGTQFNNADPLNSIIMSCHAYWNEPAATLSSRVHALSIQSVPFVFGEVGNVDSACAALELTTLLQTCEDKGVGWMAWSWHRDGQCAARNMTMNNDDWGALDDGLFSTLTPYGDLLVNNTQFGLAHHAEKADMSCEVGVEKLELIQAIYPNPFDEVIMIDLLNASEIEQITIVDVKGKTHFEHLSNSLEKRIELNVSSLKAGIYFVQIIAIDGAILVVKLVK